jgi:multiple sugar transport system ATP-binding protein
MNLLEAKLELDGAEGAEGGAKGARAVFGEQFLAIPDAVLADNPGLRGMDGRSVIVGIRPEHIYDAALDDARANGQAARLHAEVELREALGAELVMHLRTAAQRAVTDHTLSAVDADDAVVEELERQAETGEALLIARFDPRSQARLGDRVELAVDTSQLHFFDPETGQRLSTKPGEA